jgi:hypothetical protein
MQASRDKHERHEKQEERASECKGSCEALEGRSQTEGKLFFRRTCVPEESAFERFVILRETSRRMPIAAQEISRTVRIGVEVQGSARQAVNSGYVRAERDRTAPRHRRRVRKREGKADALSENSERHAGRNIRYQRA